MKAFVLVLLSMASASAYAADSGLACTMTYKSSNPFNTAQSTTSRWVADGKVMKGSAAAIEFTDEDGAHYASVKKTTMNRGQDGWSVRVYDKDGVDLGITEFRQDAAMKVIYPVEAWDQGSEDPAKFDILEVSCYYTVFAG